MNNNMNVKAMLPKNFNYSTHISSFLATLLLTKPRVLFCFLSWSTLQQDIIGNNNSKTELFGGICSMRKALTVGAVTSRNLNKCGLHVC